MKDYLIPILDEQHSVSFTGKVNILDASTKQHLGQITFYEGQINCASYRGVEGIKGFFNLCVDEFENIDMHYVVEPELVDPALKHIHYPYNTLKKKIADVIENFKESKPNRPPGHIKILIKPEFLVDGDSVSGNEYELLCTMSDYNLVKDIYKNCKLLDYEITNALVSLRKKNALTVVAKK